MRRASSGARTLLVSALLTCWAGVNVLAQDVVVSPATKTLELGKKVTFQARASGVSGKWAWSVNGVPGGNSTLGTINATGVFTAPADGGVGHTRTITATSVSTGRTGNAVVTLVFPPPQVSSISPSPARVGPQVLELSGKWFTRTSVVRIGGTQVPTEYLGRLILRAYPVFQVTDPAKVTIVVTDDAVVPRKSKPKTLTLKKPAMNGVKVAPATASLKGGQNVKFVAETQGMNSNMMKLRWAVNGIPGGNEVVGEIDEYGLYYAPDIPPNPPRVTVSATTTMQPEHAGIATIALLPPAPELHAVFPLGVRPGNFSITLRGRGFMPAASVLFNGQLLTTRWNSSKELVATGAVTAGQTRAATVQVSNPGPPVESSIVIKLPILTDPNTTSYKTSWADAGRLLEQATFGPNVASIDRVRELGVENWIGEQLGAAEYLYPPLPADSMMRRDFTERMFASHMIQAPDQLRQRMVFALGQHFVISSNKVRDQLALLEWQKMLSANAFGNFRTLLEKVTLSSAMGRYLDLANSEKEDASRSIAPNENYARELLQLFTIGLVELNLDGTPKRDTSGNEIPTYDQARIVEFSRALTGWGYTLEPGRSFSWPTREYYAGPLVPYEPAHDTGAKTLLRGTVIPAGGGPRSDLTAVLDNVFNHPNVGPFVATRLIRHFVKSNPSPQYVARVASKFNDNGAGVRGDLKAVLRAILQDVEARDAASSLDAGKLKEPILLLTNVTRALDGQLIAGYEFKPVITREMGQPLLESPTVFNFFSPLNRIGDTGLYGPEFQIFTPVTATARSNWMFRLLNQNFWREVTVNTDPYVALAPDPTQLVNYVDSAFFYRRMSSELRTKIIDTISRQSDDRGRRAMSALWLSVASGEYQVQH